MEIKVIAADVTKVTAQAVVIGCYQDEDKPGGQLAAIDQALDGAVSQLLKQGEVKGKDSEISLIHSLGKLDAERVVLVGLGKRDKAHRCSVRRAAAEACRYLQRRSVSDIVLAGLGDDIADLDAADYAQTLTEGALLGTYEFRRHITKEAEHGRLDKLTLIAAGDDVAAMEKGVNKGRIVSEAAMLARDMVNEPGNYMTPTDMANVATDIAEKYQLELTILDEPEMKKMGMGALLGVAQGSCQPPKLIVLKYNGAGGDATDLALVGKGVTFDSGGISIKPSAKMEEMKDDMAGGASVIAAISAIAQLKPRINVVAVVPAVENLPSGSAIKPGDVLVSMSGKTIEIISTDAEGRLILADALGYVNQLKPRHIVDVATLTGACIIALGVITTGAFGNDQELVDKIIAAGKKAGEPVWQMPMFDEYKEQNKSLVADVKNVGDKGAGSITAAQFLAEFAGDAPWVHLDVAGTANSDRERGSIVKGATGVPVRTLVNLALAMTDKGK
jgi:leucyl aminopeptidase